MPLLVSLGHGTLQSDVFTTTLRAAGVAVAADVRRFPASRRNPHFNGVAMREWLDHAEIAYRPFPALGGRRDPLQDSPNTVLRNSAFRGYADYMATDEFRTAFDELIALARKQPVAMFCAETLWWQCHRRLIADAAILLGGLEIRHVTPASRSSHVLTPGVRLAGDTLLYDGGEPPLLKAGTDGA
jgi:uncharacterized protein (DUF488 family)